PKTNPATIELNMDKAIDWLAKGAQPTDTTRAILSYKGVLYRQHLNKGVKKGALTQEQADEKYNAWLEQKNLKVAQKIDAVRNSKKDSVKNRLSEEEKLRQKIAEKVAAKHIAAAEAAATAAAAAIPAPVEPAEPTAPAEGESTPPAENTEGNS
ncbi:MAG: 30S ribosomal protein S16, partial [Bacteroidia bacterium]